MEELELLREMDKRGLQVQRAAEELCQAAIPATGLLVGGFYVPGEELRELRKALKVVHDYALEVAKSHGAWGGCTCGEARQARPADVPKCHYCEGGASK